MSHPDGISGANLLAEIIFKVRLGTVDSHPVACFFDSFQKSFCNCRTSCFSKSKLSPLLDIEVDRIFKSFALDDFKACLSLPACVLWSYGVRVPVSSAGNIIVLAAFVVVVELLVFLGKLPAVAGTKYCKICFYIVPVDFSLMFRNIDSSFNVLSFYEKFYHILTSIHVLESTSYSIYPSRHLSTVLLE